MQQSGGVTGRSTGADTLTPSLSRRERGSMFSPSRTLALCGVFFVLLVASLLFAARFGEQPISLAAVFREPSSSDAVIFWSVRLPRALIAAIVGAGLAASGATLQGVLRNPLAEPFVLGVSGGAALGSTLALALGLSTVGQMLPGLGAGLARLSAPTLFAFVGAAASIFFVLLASRGHGSRAVYVALLAGVIFNAFAAAAITLIKVLSDPMRLSEIFHWLAGTLSFEPVGTVVLASLLQVSAIGVMLALSGRLNLLLLGDEDASSLGVPVVWTRRLLLIAASTSVAGAVTLSGLIGFVGLIVPHLLRLAFGPDFRLLVPLSALGGAVFLLLSDLLARLAFPFLDRELPVGVVTALLGGPMFLFLLYRSARLVGP